MDHQERELVIHEEECCLRSVVSAAPRAGHYVSAGPGVRSRAAMMGGCVSLCAQLCDQKLAGSVLASLAERSST